MVAQRSFKSRNQSAVFFSPFLQAKGLQHLRSAAEAHRGTFLLDRKCGQVDGHEPVLTEGQAVLRMTRNLQQKEAIAPFKEQLPSRGLPDGQAAEYKRPGTERQALFLLVALRADQRNTFDLTVLLLRKQEFRCGPCQDGTGRLQASDPIRVSARNTSGVCTFQLSPRVLPISAGRVSARDSQWVFT
jgi:hypothetical protein